MSDKPKRGDEQGVSQGRRAFFRQAFVQAIEVVEKVGKEMQDRVATPFQQGGGYGGKSHVGSGGYTGHGGHYAGGAGYDPYLPPGHEVYGPEWPPADGPPVPMALLKELDERAGGRVSRDSVVDELDDGADELPPD